MNTKTNTLAAKIAGHKHIKVINGNVSYLMPPQGKHLIFCECIDGLYYMPFNIFTSAADREAVVIALGEKHGIHFVKYSIGWMADNGEYNVIDECPTYPEAIAAACESLRAEYELHKCCVCGTTKNVWRILGSIPYKCSSLNCVAPQGEYNGDTDPSAKE